MSEQENWHHQQRERLLSRWQTAEAKFLLQQIIRALQSQQPWTHYMESFPEVDDVYDRRDLRGVPLEKVILAGANLQGVRLSFANLSGANLAGANLSGAELDNADLSNANLRGADLTGNFVMDRIDLSGADLTEVEMAYSTLASADLTGTNLSYAHLDHSIFLGVAKKGAIFDGASLYKTEFREFAE